MRIVKRSSTTERQGEELERIERENKRLRAYLEYIGALDYPEIFEEEEEDE